jgi:hypothetical protein
VARDRKCEIAMSVTLSRLQARAQRDLYVPFSFRIALAAAKLPWAKAVSNPQSCATTLRAFQRRVQADGVVPWFDTWLEAEASGARVIRDEWGRVVGTPAPPSRLPRAEGFLEAPQVRHALEIARILCKETRAQSTVIACLTGIRTLALRLLGVRPQANASMEPAAVEIARALANAYCEVGVGALVFAAELPFADAAEARHFTPVAEVAREHGVPMMLLSRHPMSGAIEVALNKVGVDCVGAPGARLGSVCALQMDKLRGKPEASDGWFRLQRDAKPAPRLFVSEWEVPLDASVDTLIALRDKVVA